MSQVQTLLLGCIAGGTILLGLPVGRLRSPRPALSQFLNAVAIGILLFLLWDVLAHGWEPIDSALGALHGRTGGLGAVVGYGVLFVGGLGAGLLGLVYYEQWLVQRRPASSLSAMAVAEGSEAPPKRWMLTPSHRLALLIAVGIGLHNFGEGLAIGGSAASGDLALAGVLVAGFALHNATEGFGIVAPLAAEGDRPSWGFLMSMGAIGGGPTVVGTMIGRQFTSDATNVVFLTLAAGSILYVVVQLLGVTQRRGQSSIVYWGLLAGLVAGFLTDMVVTAGGA